MTDQARCCEKLKRAGGWPSVFDLAAALSPEGKNRKRPQCKESIAWPSLNPLANNKQKRGVKWVDWEKACAPGCSHLAHLIRRRSSPFKLGVVLLQSGTYPTHPQPAPSACFWCRPKCCESADPAGSSSTARIGSSNFPQLKKFIFVC